MATDIAVARNQSDFQIESFAIPVAPPYFILF